MAAHEFSALWWNLGQYGRQDIHLHHCTTESHPNCHVELVADGLACGGPNQEHRELQLLVGSGWSRKAREGEPLPSGTPYPRPKVRASDEIAPRAATPDADASRS